MSKARYILLDFDGPVCDVFAGTPANVVADQLRDQLADRLPQPLPDDVTTTSDPLHLIRRLADLAPQLGPDIEAAVQAAELEAVTTAAPTPGAHQFINTCSRTDRVIAIVTNNSAPAVQRYLTLHHLTADITTVVGRDPADPRLMKPDPHPLTEALTRLRADRSASVMIGDSPTDIDAATRCGIPTIGYINHPAKARTLRAARALITHMAQLTEATTQPAKPTRN